MDRSVPIGSYGLVGDTRSSALVAPDGSIDWWCLPAFDDPPVFGRLVGGDDAGWFRAGPFDGRPPSHRQYLHDTATLVTTWQVDGGELVLADRMVAEVSGTSLPETTLVRELRAVGRPVQGVVELRPRSGYDRLPFHRVRRCGTWTVCDAGSLALAFGSTIPEPLPLDTELHLTIEPDRPVTIVMTATRGAPATLVPPTLALQRARHDERGWRAWAAGLGDDLPHRDAVARSLITLQLMSYSPTGAPVAAPTTSLPEEIGGVRNWDYRYAWPRDAAIGVAAFLAVGKVREARSFVDWLLHASRVTRPRLPVLLRLDGRPGHRERQLEGWPGYRESRPVRVGNGAVGQHQLDGYGWVLDAAYAFTRAGQAINAETWRVMASFADGVTGLWRLPDAGIWERRGPPAHHVHSKLMGWLALDRALRIAEDRGDRRTARRRRWEHARAALADEIRQRGFNPEVGAYTAVYGSTDLDSALLLLPILEFEPLHSPRVTGTIDAVRHQLSAGGPFLYRYRHGDDGVRGGEGAFLPCSFWLVQALARTGRIDDADQLFEELLTCGEPLGLFAEEIDPSTREHLGNFPQALTHAALVQAALALRGSAGGRTDQSGPPLST